MAELKDAAIALRTRQRIRDAADALLPLGFIYRSTEGTELREIRLTSLNDALNVLILEGMQNVLKDIENFDLELLQEHLAMYSEMMEWLMRNPGAREVRSVDLPEDSAARGWIEVGEEHGDPAETRTAVAKEYAYLQERVELMTSARDALRRALEPGEEKVRKQAVPDYIIRGQKKLAAA